MKKIEIDKFTFFNADNMEIMAQYPDKYFDLCIVDPPYDYSISETHNILNTKKFKGTQEGRTKSGFKIGNSRVDALEKPSNKEYFDELFRISKAEKLDVIAKRLKNGRYTESMFSESLLKDLEVYK